MLRAQRIDGDYQGQCGIDAARQSHHDAWKTVLGDIVAGALHQRPVHTLLLALQRNGVGRNGLDRTGRRFVDESIPYKALGDASLAQDGARTWQVFDATVMAQSNDEVPIYDFTGRLNAGMLEVADTIDELASRLGTEPGVLEKTVAEVESRWLELTELLG